jgi:hypothetical protein
VQDPEAHCLPDLLDELKICRNAGTGVEPEFDHFPSLSS